MRVWHMSGAGNDFMVIDARGQVLDFSKLALALCAKTGADGFMAVDNAKEADFKLHFYNADGTRGEMCGNGARCICKFAYELGIVGDKMSVETDAGEVLGWRLGENRYKVKLNNPGILDIHRLPEAAYVELGTPGVPHSVTRIPGLAFDQKELLLKKAKALRDDPVFPKGVNVNFYDLLDETTVRVLTYERGVEDYTLACGTGCGATAAVLWTQGKLPGGVLTAHNEGGILTVTVEGSNGVIEALYLEGAAETLHIYEL